MQATSQILIVDDEPALLRMMKVYLQRMGYAVTTTASTDEAASLPDADIRGFAVAVLDATMAGLGLNELALQMLRQNPSLRIIAASGYPVDMSALEAAAPGHVAFLHKPFTPEMLAASVRRMLAAKEEGV